MSVPMNSRRLYVVFFIMAAASILMSGCGKQKSSYDLLSEAQEYHSKGQDNTAIIELKNALQQDPKNGEARYLLALIHIDRGDGAAAEIELHKALQLGVNKDKIYAGLGQALLLQQEYQKILDDIRPSDEYKGKLAADIYIARGDAYLGLGKMDEAKSAFDSALTQVPGILGCASGHGAARSCKKRLECRPQTDGYRSVQGHEKYKGLAYESGHPAHAG